MTTVTAETRQLSAEELSRLYCAGDLALPALLAIDRADVAEVAKRARSDRARAAARRRHSEWEAAAYAQYERAEESCSYLLNDAGKARGRNPWPMLWQGNEQDARRLASEELLRYWDYDSPRVPPAAAYAASQRASERAAREQASDARPAHAPSPVEAPRPAGSIARYMTALALLERQADRTARALSRVSGGIPR